MLLRALICVVVAAVPTASLGGFGVRRVSTSRAGLGVRRLGGAPRAATAAPAADPAAAAIKEEILAMTRPFGDPAINVPPDVQAAVSAKCKELEALNPTAKPATADAASNDGVWRVRYSDAVPPSNGQIGPFVGEPFQIVDTEGVRYQNLLDLGWAKVRLCADWKTSGDSEWRVAFRTITFSLSANPLIAPTIKFPEGTERTWVLTYTDSNTRVVRAGVDGGKSTARSLGLVEEGVGEAKDAFVFFMTRESERGDLELRS